MKILFVSGNYEHANDSELNLIYSLMENAEVDFFGPGYSTRHELQKGLKNYWYRGNYDVLIAGFYPLAVSQTAYLDIRFEYFYFRYAMSDYSIYECVRYADRIMTEAKEMDVPKLVHYHCDTYNMSENIKNCLQDLLDAGFYLWAGGEEFVPEIEEKENEWGNKYLTFCRKNADRIVSMNWHVASYKEYYGAPLETRKYDITVPGNLDPVMYPDREKIVRKLREGDYTIYDEYVNRVLAYRDDDKRMSNTLYKREEDRILDEKLKSPCCYISTVTRRESMMLWRENYNLGLRASKMGYADGGVALQIVRKFTEIPARGTLLLCQDIPPLACFGFKAWENMVPVTPDSVLEICDRLYSDPDQMQAIAAAGRAMVFRKHSPAAYGRHMIDAINVIKSGRFHGSYWFDGEFYIN